MTTSFHKLIGGPIATWHQHLDMCNQVATLPMDITFSQIPITITYIKLYSNHRLGKGKKKQKKNNVFVTKVMNIQNDMGC